MSDVFTVREWCDKARCSKPFLYQLWKQGEGPRSVSMGRKRVILEAPGEFFRRVAEERVGEGEASK